MEKAVKSYLLTFPLLTMIPVVVILLLLTALVATEPSSPGNNGES